MNNYRGWLVTPAIPARRQLFVNSVTLCAYDVAGAMGNGNFAIVALSLFHADMCIMSVRIFKIIRYTVALYILNILHWSLNYYSPSQS